jgi:hypothetical protein
MVPVGYMAKRVLQRPDWLQATRVIDIYSLSGCVSEDFAVDRECRWSQEDGIWVLRTTCSWLRCDLDVLRPLVQRMQTEGADFLQNNAALAEEIRRTLVDLDEKELKKAARAIESAAGLTTKYKSRLQGLCENSHPRKMPHGSEEANASLSR